MQPAKQKTSRLNGRPVPNNRASRALLQTLVAKVNKGTPSVLYRETIKGTRKSPTRLIKPRATTARN